MKLSNNLQAELAPMSAYDPKRTCSAVDVRFLVQIYADGGPGPKEAT
jgi:hypothetical protein